MERVVYQDILEGVSRLSPHFVCGDGVLKPTHGGCIEQKNPGTFEAFDGYC